MRNTTAFAGNGLETYFVTHTVIGIGSLDDETLVGKGTYCGPTVLPW